MKKLTVFLLAATLLATCLATAFRVDGLRARKDRDHAASEQRRLQNELGAAEIRLAQAQEPGVEADGVPGSVLKNRIAELERDLISKGAELEKLRTQVRPVETAASPAVEEQPRERNPEDWRQRQRERMEELREEDPEEYARIQQERRDFQQRVADNLGGQVEFLSALSMEGLAQEQLDNHDVLIARLTSFRERVNLYNPDPTAEESGVSRRELFQEFREIAPLLEQERQIVLKNLAVDLGYAPEEAGSFAEYVDYVNEMTSPRAMMRGWGGGRRGGRGGP